eukprot:1112219-Amphidinium_carterae.2
MLSSDSFFSSASSFVLKCRTPVSIVANKSFFAGVLFVVSLRLTGCCCCGVGNFGALGDASYIG